MNEETTFSHAMGSFFSRCLNGSGGVGVDDHDDNDGSIKDDSLDDAQHANLIAVPATTTVTGGTGHINFIYRIMRKSKRHRSDTNRSRFLERFWAIRDMRYTRLTSSRSQSSSNTSKTMPTEATMKRSTSKRRNHQPQNNGDSINVDDNDIQLQCLDAQLLLSATDRQQLKHQQQLLQLQSHQVRGQSSNGSPASSSLDLEWEHEAGASQRAAWMMTADESEATTASSSSGGSSGSSSSSSASSVASAAGRRRRRPFVGRMKSAVASYAATKRPTVVVKTTEATRSLSRNNSWSHRSTPDSLEWDVDEQPPNRMRSSEEDLLDTETMELLQEIEWLKMQALNETGATLREPGVLLETES